MKKKLTGKLSLNKKKISNFTTSKITGGTQTGTCPSDAGHTYAGCGHPDWTRNGGSACKCK